MTRDELATKSTNIDPLPTSWFFVLDMLFWAVAYGLVLYFFVVVLLWIVRVNNAIKILETM